MIITLLYGNVKVEAKDNSIQIKSISIEEKSEGVKSTVVDKGDLNFNVDLYFYNLNDYVKYKLILNNYKSFGRIKIKSLKFCFSG